MFNFHGSLDEVSAPPSQRSSRQGPAALRRAGDQRGLLTIIFDEVLRGKLPAGLRYGLSLAAGRRVND